MDPLETVAPAFVDLAHQIVWATAATVSTAGEPATRILHPIWEWNGETLRGWLATSPLSPKARHLEQTPMMSITYWRPDHDTCTVRCRTSWDFSAAGREALWERFTAAPEPLGYVPSIIPGWESPASPAFASLELDPDAIRLLQAGVRLSWRAS